jgi:hypothetical protein
MTANTLDTFEHKLLHAWTEPDPAKRRSNIEAMFASDGRIVAAAPVGATMQGIDQIAALITQVYDENIAGQGLSFTYDQRIQAGDATLLRWSMRTPDNKPVARGAEVLFRDSDGAIATDYLFMGVD